MNSEDFVKEFLKFYYDSVVMKKKDMLSKFDTLAEKAIEIVTGKSPYEN